MKNIIGWRSRTLMARSGESVEIMFACDTEVERRAINEALASIGWTVIAQGQGRYYNSWVTPPEEKPAAPAA